MDVDPEQLGPVGREGDVVRAAVDERASAREDIAGAIEELYADRRAQKRTAGRGQPAREEVWALLDREGFCRGVYERRLSSRWSAPLGL